MTSTLRDLTVIKFTLRIDDPNRDSLSGNLITTHIDSRLHLSGCGREAQFVFKPTIDTLAKTNPALGVSDQLVHLRTLRTSDTRNKSFLC